MSSYKPTCVYLCERALNLAQLIRTKSQLSLARCTPLSAQERFERFFLRGIERPTMPRHIRMQQSTNPKVQAYMHPYIVKSSDAPDQLLLEIGIAPVALVTVRPVRRRLRELPHEYGH